MNKNRGWLRLFLVYALFSAAIFFHFGSKAYRAESNSIRNASELFLAGTTPNFALTENKKTTVEYLGRRQELNMTNRVQEFGSYWLISLFFLAIVIQVLRYIIAGFKSQSQ